MVEQEGIRTFGKIKLPGQWAMAFTLKWHFPFVGVRVNRSKSAFPVASTGPRVGRHGCHHSQTPAEHGTLSKMSFIDPHLYM